MKTIKMLITAVLCAAMLFSACFAQTAPAQCIPGTFAFGCFAYDIPFVTGVNEDGSYATHNGTYGVKALRLDAPAADEEAAKAAAQQLYGAEVELTLGEDGVYRAEVTGDLSYFRIYIKDDTALMLSCAVQTQLAALDRNVVLLDEPVWSEDGAPAAVGSEYVPLYLPFGTEGVAGHDLSIWKQAAEAMLPSGEYGMVWDEPQYADENHCAVSCFIPAFSRSVTFVTENESGKVVSVQWSSFLPTDSETIDLYNTTMTSCETGAAISTAMFFADMGLDMAKMSANVAALQGAFTALQSWMNAVATDTLQVPHLLESSTLIIGRDLTLRVTTDPIEGHRIEGCLRTCE